MTFQGQTILFFMNFMFDKHACPLTHKWTIINADLICHTNQIHTFSMLQFQGGVS